MFGFLACRVQRLEWLEIVAETGLRYVEIKVPEPNEFARLYARLKRLGLEPGAVAVKMNVQHDEGIQHVHDDFGRVADLGAKIAFTSVKAESADLRDVYSRLRRVGDSAERRGLTVALETHPDLIVNGDQTRLTMDAVDHPRIRVNFDPANIYFHNNGLTALDELKKVASRVAAIHLKDSTGACRCKDFPPVGQGIVDFPGIFEVLRRHGFDGPLTFEIEGERIQGDDSSLRFKRFLHESLQYIRDLWQ